MKKRKGFTLIELIIVVTIIGILGVVGIEAYRGSQATGRDNKRKRDLGEIQQSLEFYRRDNVGVGYPSGNGDVDTELGLILTSPIPYFPDGQLPQDPQIRAGIFYGYSSSAPLDYALCALLESPLTSDPICPDATLMCGSGVLCNYGVSAP